MHPPSMTGHPDGTHTAKAAPIGSYGLVGDTRTAALVSDDGDKLLELQTGLRSGMGPPITYRLDGRQYVAVMGGVGTVAGGNAGPGNQATPFLPKLMVFVLDGGPVTAPAEK